MRKRLLSLLLTVAMVLSLLTFPVSAETATTGTCGDTLTWTLDEGVLTIRGEGKMTDYNGDALAPWYSSRTSITSVEIEAGVTSIGSCAFYSCTRLTDITIPEGVTDIGWSAFYECTRLTSITIPESVTSIGSHAFVGCSSLTSIKIPDGVTSIDKGAFLACDSVTSIRIPCDVISIGESAFSQNSNLADVYYGGSEEDWNYISIDSANGDLKNATMHYLVVDYGTCGENLTWILYTDGTLTISGTGAMTDYRDVSVPWDAYRASITSVVVEDGVTSIGEDAFRDCTSLASVTIPSTVTIIDFGAFEGCTSLTGITIPEGVTRIGSNAFWDCTSLNNITIPDTVTFIGDGAFYSCTSLTSITIPEGVTSIDSLTFGECSSLASITIPDGVTSIGNLAFYSCSSLTSITIPDSVNSIEQNAFTDCSSLTSITIPEGITRIDEGVFSGCSSLTSITIPESVTSIEYSAFNDCGIIYIAISDDITGGTLAVPRTADYKDTVTITPQPDIGYELSGHPTVTTVNNDSVEVTQGENGTYSFIKPSAAVTVSANFEKVLYTLEVSESTNGSLTASATEANYGDSITITPKADTGYQLSELKVEGTDSVAVAKQDDGTYTFTMPASNVTVTATFSKITYTVTYNANGGQGTMEDQTVTYGTDAVLSTNAFTRSGYTFTGWNTAANGTGTPYADGNTVNLTQSITLYAQWSCNHETTEVKNAVTATCTKDGYTGDTYCSVCGEKLEEGKTIPATGHNWDDGEVTTEPTCTKTGVKTYTCKNGCGETETETIDALGHDYAEEFTIDKAATCIEAGSKSKHCSRCDATTEVTEIPATDHDWDEGKVTKAATCTENGEKTYTCATCNETKTETIDALGHDYAEEFTIDKAATCTEAGSKSKHCSRCDATTEVTEIPATDHSWDEGVITTAAGCTSDGVKTYTCANCGKTRTEAISATGHTVVTVEAKAATCTEPGYTEGTKCSVCGAIISGLTEIPAIGHDWDEGKVTTEPTCTETGVKTYTCKNGCGGTKTETVPATGHTPVVKDAKEATVTEDGYTGDTYCSVCGEKLATGTVIPKTGPEPSPEPSPEPDPEPTITLFDDVQDSSSWYYTPVYWAVENHITSGTGNNMFSPSKECTRAQIVTFLWNSAGQPEPTTTDNPFTDVSSSAWYYKAVLWAAENKITAGTTATTFSPDMKCSRAQIVTFLWNYAGKPVATQEVNFSDVSSSAWYYTAVQWAVENKVTSGTGNNKFSPDTICSRAQAVTFLYNYMGK